MTKAYSHNRTYVLYTLKKVGAMRLLSLATEKQRWALAAHTIIMATARLLNGRPCRSNQRGIDKLHVTKRKEKHRHINEQSEN
jgi:hypothetical protein